jgi:hypothetical protein
MQPCDDLLEKRAALDCTLNKCCLVNPPIALSNRHGQSERSGREIERSPSSSAEISRAVLVHLLSCWRLINLASL